MTVADGRGRPLRRRDRREEHLNARIFPVNVFVQVRFDNAVIVESKAFAECILRNLQSPVYITSQCRREIKSDGERKTTRLQMVQQCSPMGKCRQRQPDELPNLRLVGTAGRRK